MRLCHVRRLVGFPGSLTQLLSSQSNTRTAATRGFGLESRIFPLVQSLQSSRLPEPSTKILPTPWSASLAPSEALAPRAEPGVSFSLATAYLPTTASSSIQSLDNQHHPLQSARASRPQIKSSSGFVSKSFAFTTVAGRPSVAARTMTTDAPSHTNYRRSHSQQTIQSSPMKGVSNGAGGDRKKPFLIGVGGGTASGKSTVCERIMREVEQRQNGTERKIIALSQDSFYRELNEKEIILAENGNFNFDHPDAFDHELMLACLKDIHEGKHTKVPIYDFKTNARKPGEHILVHPSDVVLLEGILVFYHSDVRDMFDMKLFVDTDADTRLARRVLRDIEERGRDLGHILLQYTTLVKPAFEEFCLPTKKFADVIIPRGADNSVAIALIARHISDILRNPPSTRRDVPAISPVSFKTPTWKRDPKSRSRRPH